MRHFRTITGTALLATFAMALVLTLVVQPAEAAFPGKNGKILFSSSRAGNGDILAINPGGTSLVNLTRGSGARDYRGAWSPDGKQIAYARNVGGNVDIYVKTIATNKVVRVTTSSVTDALPAWKPDGKRLVFTSNRSGGECGSFELYTVKPAREGATNRPVQLTKTCGNELSPAWSPKGNLIAFELGGDVAVIQPNSAGFRYLTTNNLFSVRGSYFNPSWSPNGAQVAFDNRFDVFRISVTKRGGKDCLGCVNLTRNSSPHTTQSNEDPAYSPDGTKIAFQTNRAGNNDIFTMNATDGSIPINVTRNGANDTEPDWQRR